MNKRPAIRRSWGVACALLGALGAIAPPAMAGAAEGLVWLVPDRAPEAGFTAGLTLIDAKGMARLPSRESTAVRVSGGALRELPAVGPVRAFAVEPSAPLVSLQAQGPAEASARVVVGPPRVRVALAAHPARPIKGRDTSTEVEIEVVCEDGGATCDLPAPLLRSNVGTVEPIQARGGGRFSAIFRLPSERRPEVAILVAFVPWPHADAPEGAFGALSIPLASAVALPGTTEPGANIRVEIAGEHFGPVVASGSGEFEVPVVVPPGHRTATVVTADPAGNQRRREVDLHLPPTDQLACVANPMAVPVDGATRVRVLCAASDPFGAPAADAALTGRAEQGQLRGPRPLSTAGLFEWTYVPPQRGPGHDRLRFDFPAGGPQSTEEIEIDLLPLPPAHAELQVSPEPVLLGSEATVHLRALDALGRPVATRPRLAAARGHLGDFRQAGEDLLEARYTPPDELGDWSDRIAGEVLAVAGRVPARLRLTVEEGHLSARAETLAENPVEGVEIATPTARARSDIDGRAELPLPPSDASAPGGLIRVDAWVAERPSVRASLWRVSAAPSGAPVWFPHLAPAEKLRIDQPVALGPATPVDVRLELIAAEGSHPAMLRFRIADPDGRPLAGRDVLWKVTADGAPLSGHARELADGSVEVQLPPGTRGRVRATVLDRATGVSAAQEAVLP